jgi:hypothetical protein
MSIVVMVGPSLGRPVLGNELDAIWLPPVSQGDVYRAAREATVAIGIIDGYFECVPSVWHKEILYALSRGIRVFGAASMGALRAAELAPFGMEGVGAIFEAYRDGVLEDDDEVAVIHGPAQFGYPVLSEAMVNIRRTLSEAFAVGIISADTQKNLVTISKNLPYRERTYAAALALGRQRGLPGQELELFRNWLPEGRVDQKREDALLMLRVMRHRLQGRPEPKRAGFHFENTTLWERATRLSAA